MKFQIEQIAICPPDPDAAKDFLRELGAEFVTDRVQAHGMVRGKPEQTNTADLAFDYDLCSTTELKGQLEFEVLHYREGTNWMDKHGPSASHLAMHCTEEELDRWKLWMTRRHIQVAQEVFTESHTNPFLIEEGRRYHYCIFDTRHILGIDLKFIVRIQ